MKNQELWAQGIQDGFNNLVDHENQNPLYWRGVTEGDRRYHQWLAEGRFTEQETFVDALQHVQEDYHNPVGMSLLSAFAI